MFVCAASSLLRLAVFFLPRHIHIFAFWRIFAEFLRSTPRPLGLILAEFPPPSSTPLSPLPLTLFARAHAHTLAGATAALPRGPHRGLPTAARTDARRHHGQAGRERDHGGSVRFWEEWGEWVWVGG